MTNKSVYAITVKQIVTPLSLACGPEQGGPFWRIVYVVESKHFTISGKVIESEDGPVTDSFGKPVLIAPGVPIEEVWECAADIYLPLREYLSESESAVLPVGETIQLLRSERGVDEYSWVIFSLNLIYECLRPTDIPLEQEIEGTYWEMQDFFTEERNIEKFVRQTGISGEQAASVLQWGLNTVKDNAHIVDR
jgi:hypothetical protein